MANARGARAPLSAAALLRRATSTRDGEAWHATVGAIALADQIAALRVRADQQDHDHLTMWPVNPVATLQALACKPSATAESGYTAIHSTN